VVLATQSTGSRGLGSGAVEDGWRTMRTRPDLSGRVKGATKGGLLTLSLTSPTNFGEIWVQQTT
jgi:hypothetical protein